MTGAQLIGRQLEVAGTLVDDIRNGTPVPVAVGRAVVSFINIELDAGRELVGFGRELADFQIQFVGNLVSGLPPVVAVPVGNVLALGSAAVDTVSDLANGVLDGLEASLPTPGANVQVKSAVGAPVTESTRQTSRRLDNIVTLRRDNPKSTAVERVSAIAANSSAGDTEHGIIHELRDAVRRNISTSVSSTADKPNAGGEHQQRHRRDRQQDNSGDGPCRTRQRGALDPAALPLVGQFGTDHVDGHRLVVAAARQHSDQPAHHLRRRRRRGVRGAACRGPAARRAPAPRRRRYRPARR